MGAHSDRPAAGSTSSPRDDGLHSFIVRAATLAAGDDLVPGLARLAAEGLAARHVFLTVFDPPDRLRSLARWSDGGPADPIEYPLEGTPCAAVIGGAEVCEPSGLGRRFPRFDLAAGCEAYLGVPLRSHDGLVLGHLAALFATPVAPDESRLDLLRACAARAAAELDRRRIEHSLRASEDRYRDLFDEAPIAYVIEDLESRFIRANRTAVRTLGLRPEQVEGFVGVSLIPDTPEAQRRVREALTSIGQGTDTSGVVLELRRHDDGRPLWIQWWSRPDPSGTFTRTMFVDITDKVLMQERQTRLEAQNLYLQEEIKSVYNFEEIVGRSRGLAHLLADVSRVAGTDATVLILGETGTGKELIARAIHSASRRADRPFIKINCAALPPGLVESELFGHERGAFSGALQRRAGRFELAHTGTIFLDEIGEMPLDVQVKLLRVLQEREFERVGSSETRRTDVRVIAATNRDLVAAIRAGQFREDLYYRLNVFPVQLPPLRARTEDIPLLVEHFIDKYAPRVGRSMTGIAPGTLEQLVRYPWPGNIRELENLVERTLILATTPLFQVEPAMLPGVPRPPAAAVAPTAAAPSAPGVPLSPAAPPPTDLNAVQREHIINTLHATRWVIEGEHGAAGRLGLKPATLRHRMKKLGIGRNPPPSG